MFSSIPDTTEEFWQKVETTLGCSVLAYALAQYSRTASRRGNKNALWGLAYVSERGLHFYRFAQQSWMGSLMNRAPSQEFSLTLWFENIEAWYLPKKLPFLKALFTAENTRLAVRGMSTELPLLGHMAGQEGNKKQSEAKIHYFALDVRRRTVEEALNAYIADKRSAEKAAFGFPV